MTYVSGDDDEFDVVFFATGRTPNTAELGLEKAGVEVEEGGASRSTRSGAPASRTSSRSAM